MSVGWMNRAACRGEDTEMFFDGGEGNARGHSDEKAKRVCSGCSVVSDCLAYALSHDIRFGVWGNTSEDDRRRLRRNGQRRANAA